MAKRKAGVNDIIYELENDDIELSSDEEGKKTKIGRLPDRVSKKQCLNPHNSREKYTEVINLDSSSDGHCDTLSTNFERNGGKTTLCIESQNSFCKNVDKIKNNNKAFRNKTFPFPEHSIAVDSPISNSDLDVVGCENRTPLVTVRFKDRKLAHTYKQKVREFLINLLKTQKDDCDSLSRDSDVEVDIWPEDLFDEEFDKIDNIDVEFNKSKFVDSYYEDFEDSLFFVDTAPCDDPQTEIPKYSQSSSIISNVSEKNDCTEPTFRRGPTCFNCDGAHQLKDCSLPRNHNRIAAKRKTMAPRVGRYHVEDEQKYGHLIPGRISGNLRHALGLLRNELPLHVYRMRLLGYPPGWLEEARISHSGITLFDSTGNATQDPEDEKGEIFEPGSKDKFDIKKIHDFPGFNVPASPRYTEDCRLFGLPPISDQDSKIGMLEMLAPNAMMAYKRKKLTFFPSASKNTSQGGHAEMDLDSGDEVTEFPSIPPLPDEEPPLVPPPPPPLPPPPPTPPPPPGDETEDSENLPSKDEISNKDKKSVHTNLNNEESSKKEVFTNPYIDKEKENLKNDNSGSMDNEINLASSDDELQVIEVVQVPDIPVPEDELITIDDDKSLLSSGPDSPSLAALEERKNHLLDALKGTGVSALSIDLDGSFSDYAESIENINEKTVEEKSVFVPAQTLTFKIDNELSSINEDVKTPEKTIDEAKNANIDVSSDVNEEVVIELDAKSSQVKNIQVDNESSTTKEVVNTPNLKTGQVINTQVDNVPSTAKEVVSTPDTKASQEKNIQNDSESYTAKEFVSTPDTKTGQVKNTSYGTPVLNAASPFVKLPSDDKFAKDICDVINFENLPNSTGKYKRISSLLKKVKYAVDKIQES